jgi:hypothetical protein
MLFLSLIVSRSTFLKGIVLSMTSASPHQQPSSILASSQTENPIIVSDAYQIASQEVRKEITRLIQGDPAWTGPLVRLAFHDGATAENDTIQFEIMERSENRGLGKPLGIVQQIRNNSSIINHLSLADTIALSGAASIEAIGGPSIRIRLGRQDSTSSDPQYLRQPLEVPSKLKNNHKFDLTSRSLVTTTLPSAALDSDGLRLYFQRLGLSEAEFVALSGIHGLGRHVSLLNMPKACLKNLTRECLEDAPTLLPFVTSGVDKFDTSYFTYLLKWYAQSVELGEVAFIPTDVALVVDPGLRRYVQQFASNEKLYRRTLCRAYQTLVDRTATTDRRY